MGLTASPLRLSCRDFLRKKEMALPEKIPVHAVPKPRMIDMPTKNPFRIQYRKGLFTSRDETIRRRKQA
jgi:hypothetical protein